MMRIGAVVRDLALLCLAIAVGWWWRGGGTTTVLAQRSSSSSSARSDDSLAFQISGIGQDTALTVYNPSSRTLYVYPRVATGNSYINCEFSFTVAMPGAPIERKNCPMGEQLPQR
jgi:hypothetical protein